ncbi:MAG: copper resistance protein B [Alteraurantiacibacter sp.]
MDHSMHQGHDMSTMQAPAPASTPTPVPADPHAGHNTPGGAPAVIGPASQAGPSGTDLAPGSASPPPIARDRAADRFFDAEAMAQAEATLLGEHGGMIFHKVQFNLAEYRAGNGSDGYRWDASAWFGGGIDRLAIKSEGDGSFGEALDHGEVQALWSRAVDPYWNLQGGVRQDFGQGPDRTYAVLGIEGLAPYWFDLGASAYLSNKGDVLARIEGDIDQRITQRLILQPRVEANFAAQDIPASGLGAGLSDLELGLRLRYELRREFAPYVGLSWDRKFGDTADYARAAGEQASSTNFVAGIRFWF